QEDIAAIEKQLQDCEHYLESIRQNRDIHGISLAITFEMRRISQTIQRLRDLLYLLITKNYEQPFDTFMLLFKRLLAAESEKNSLSHQFTQNTNLLAFQITEHARKTGEHYITNNKEEYLSMFKGAAGGGLVVSILVFTKLLIYYFKPAPIALGLLYGLNYAVGFIIIHLLHFTLATKQPAMTASAIASALDTDSPMGQQVRSLTTMIIKIVRSQFIALIGNVAVALPMAYLWAWVFYAVTGTHFATVEKATQLIAELHPIHSLSLYYAGVAGVYLFVSGLLSGLHDNMCVFYNIPQRIEQQPLLKKLLRPSIRQHIANYIKFNLGGIAGNFYLGMLLGISGLLGLGFGVPLDIRHITFSAGNLGLSLAALDHQIDGHTLFVTLVGIFSIGMVNLLVSFTLALYVAVKSRGVTFFGFSSLLRRLLVEFLGNPLAFLLPPKE
ncbi:MAG: hypothetical protein ACOVQA_10225, partial [Thermoflexibacteraceae bacterium]